ncbi:protein-glutamate methylesterase/protein-glutamine glutaminase [Pseudalkalibacillus salsuginis]|uniref:protein-glutamate methylesterase/protein-glutamine glutaminase n=1 Tax=Pseudalkalibacillus salsuginis TaxID=2910972 RepID=UPI001F24F7BF|nr:chemotaxis response regulator protein-glutamate methylesterase [Pseudalkalibacillus salsuginis]MCF6410587.1 chemotaxis response regulator protein-glutamate methylesterase [Pseudalkalibacillus salsuginis]
MNQIKVLVVDDSAFMRKVISDLLSGDPSILVVGSARNGEDALRKIPQLTPDVVTLDVDMPVMDGLTTLKKIMEHFAIPVIMLSSVTKAGAAQTIESIQAGAVDFIPKPSGAISLDIHKVQEELLRKVKVASEVKIKDHLAEKKPIARYTKEPMEKGLTKKHKIIAIGTSTGGPKALVEVISNLPDSINVPVLIVQHMPVGFTKSLAERLNKLSSLSVMEAVSGEPLMNNTVYIAPGGYHLKAVHGKNGVVIELDDDTPPNRGHRPSVDEMFYSLSRLKDYQKIAVIMTGMGSDGTEGLLALKKEADTIAIAESEESCVVYGMPRSAIATQKVDEIVHVTEISERIVRYL